MDKKESQEDLETVKSNDGNHTVELVSELEPLRKKDEDEWVAVFHGRYNNEDVIAKYFLVTGATLTETGAPRTESIRSYNEVAALMDLRDKNCTSAPHYIHDFRKTTDEGYKRWVLLTYLPGTAVSILVDNNDFDFEGQKDEIKRAFGVAMRELWRCGVDSKSPHLGNVLWDGGSKKCYIVDFEQADTDFVMPKVMPTDEELWKRWKDQKMSSVAGSNAGANAGSNAGSIAGSKAASKAEGSGKNKRSNFE
ncbi:hypothetical protein M409DRAFT_52956 [Zasmidium cellare ATCC 36951]|uniref:Aminoglycoside phosphotransferase domain-containing protein n=1 Tax=Zasmidium cellare ATCC 36951 TaxID=1080233 RepID=A0A6A6CNX8_ZASCE|nr:uncharacterized protein M409DRAFT_52956 [Zasmidium cellare ATCC 36951]KAF2168977.1 hypothetical protein M409DRAFT_52956 [Zasmidium cellare ATCC 36951]